MRRLLRVCVSRPSVLALAVLFAGWPAPWAWADEVPEDEVLVLDDFDDEAAEYDEQNSEDFLETEEINVESVSLDEDIGKGSFETPIIVEGSRNFNEMVESIPGVFGDQSSKGQRKLMIRGYDIRQFSLRFEGVPLDTGYDSHTGLDNIPAQWIGGGVLKRASAGAMDSLGLGAGIELTRAKGPLMAATVGMDLHGFEFGLSHHGSAGQWEWGVAGGGLHNDGWELSNQFKPSKYEDGGLRENTDKSSYNILLNGTRRLGDWGNVELLAGWMHLSRGVAIGVGTVTPNFWRFPNWDIALATAKLNFARSGCYGNVQTWFVYQGNELRTYDTFAMNSQEHQGSYNSYFQDYDAGLSVEGGSMPWGLGRAGLMDFRLKSEFRYQYHASQSDTPSENTHDESETDRILWNVRPGLYWKISDKFEIFASGAAILNADLTRPENGLEKVDLVNMWNGEFSFGADLLPMEDMRISARAARRVRMPTLKEQYGIVRNGSENRDGNLNAEYAWDFQLLFDWKISDKVHFSLSGFDSEVEDLINFIYVDGLRVAVNIDQVRLAGADAALKLGAWYGLSVDLSYAYLYAWNIIDDVALYERPAHALRARVNYSPVKWFHVGVTFQFESERLSEDWTGTKVYTLGNVYLLSADTGLKFDRWSLLFKVNNILDLNYSRAYGYPEEGRSYYLNAKVTY